MAENKIKYSARFFNKNGKAIGTDFKLSLSCSIYDSELDEEPLFGYTISIQSDDKDSVFIDIPLLEIPANRKADKRFVVAKNFAFPELVSPVGTKLVIDAWDKDVNNWKLYDSRRKGPAAYKKLGKNLVAHYWTTDWRYGEERGDFFIHFYVGYVKSNLRFQDLREQPEYFDEPYIHFSVATELLLNLRKRWYNSLYEDVQENRPHGVEYIWNPDHNRQSHLFTIREDEFQKKLADTGEDLPTRDSTEEEEEEDNIKIPEKATYPPEKWQLYQLERFRTKREIYEEHRPGHQKRGYHWYYKDVYPEEDIWIEEIRNPRDLIQEMRREREERRQRKEEIGVEEDDVEIIIPAWTPSPDDDDEDIDLMEPMEDEPKKLKRLKRGRMRMARGPFEIRDDPLPPDIVEIHPPSPEDTEDPIDLTEEDPNITFEVWGLMGERKIYGFLRYSRGVEIVTIVVKHVATGLLARFDFTQDWEGGLSSENFAPKFDATGAGSEIKTNIGEGFGFAFDAASRMFYAMRTVRDPRIHDEARWPEIDPMVSPGVPYIQLKISEDALYKLFYEIPTAGAMYSIQFVPLRNTTWGWDSDDDPRKTHRVSTDDEVDRLMAEEMGIALPTTRIEIEIHARFWSGEYKVVALLWRAGTQPGDQEKGVTIIIYNKDRGTSLARFDFVTPAFTRYTKWIRPAISFNVGGNSVALRDTGGQESDIVTNITYTDDQEDEDVSDFEEIYYEVEERNSYVYAMTARHPLASATDTSHIPRRRAFAQIRISTDSLKKLFRDIPSIQYVDVYRFQKDPDTNIYIWKAEDGIEHVRRTEEVDIEEVTEQVLGIE